MFSRVSSPTSSDSEEEADGRYGSDEEDGEFGGDNEEQEEDMEE